MEKTARVCGITRRAAFAIILCVPSLGFVAASSAAPQGQIRRHEVASSVLAAVSYDTGKRVLELEFHSGAIYRYLEVPEEIFNRLLAAESKGQFFGAAIRDKFRSERVKPRNAK